MRRATVIDVSSVSELAAYLRKQQLSLYTRCSKRIWYATLRREDVPLVYGYGRALVEGRGVSLLAALSTAVREWDDAVSSGLASVRS